MGLLLQHIDSCVAAYANRSSSSSGATVTPMHPYAALQEVLNLQWLLQQRLVLQHCSQEEQLQLREALQLLTEAEPRL